ncbi:MAG: hypothetical protein LQ341_004356 [Variospora aurantia]|nr:MAG: hypothetical protein LQ341_004356 [Variospora aurantia]
MEEAPRKFIHEWHEDTENLDSYQPGWYHPVDIGQVYSEGRYRIIHKLGFGTYSTVWLARDSRLERYVALKILAAEPSKDSTESQIIRQISQCFKTSSHINKAFILPILDEFEIDGPNGQHRCLATEPAACSLSVSKSYPPWVFRIEVARAIAAQTILALRAIHQCNVVHGGKSRMPSYLPYADYLHDLHLHNILFILRDINHMSVDEIYHHFSTPEKIKVNRVDGGPLSPGVPSHSISPANVFVDSLKVDDPHICITDFGESWLGDAVHPKGYLNTPMLYRPPEAIFAKELLSFPADIWTLACSVFEIMGERGLFEAFFPDEADMVAEMVSCLGPLPSSWWDAWEERSEFFVEKGVWRTDMTRPREPRSRPLRSRIQTMGRQEHPDSLSADEAESLAVMLTTMLEYDPAKRATADDVVNSDWMTRWGLPSLKPFNIPV